MASYVIRRLGYMLVAHTAHLLRHRDRSVAGELGGWLAWCGASCWSCGSWPSSWLPGWQFPWLMIPALFVVVAVLACNFLGDVLRDAADPYK